ncbi:hypothetical protein AB6A40_007309 [Gnathostoma spinigerum]|uniref:Protein kinase domain-containing protein n=1 Tax=Gnathostoma spinigerum TaxID=75299 RepID=A0ABD6EKV6_9BILA
MTIGVGGSSRSSTSRGSRLGKLSSSRVKSNCGSTSAGGCSSFGGQPLNGASANSGRADIKHRFEITRKLGSGTYGKVSLAYDQKTEREVAVKLIKKSAIESKQDLIRIRREIRIMSALKHPNIIQIYEVFENKDKIILVMEYASGGELYDYVSMYGSLPEAEARRVFRQIVSAVLYCHKHQVAHRDLKLENILLDANNNAKIADFGLSNYFSDKSLLSTFCGSPLYASPEIINGTPYRGPEVDCWSLGILLYTLVYGSMPFDGRDFNRMVRQIKRGAYFEPDTPSTASMLIRNMLRVNPERRADIDEIASHWWLNLDENMPVIQELPENQITDYTPLTERAETMVVQDLADETDVFMEFGHLSASTRLKIEEFRRRRKEAEEYNANSPVKPPKARKTGERGDERELTSMEKSLRNDPLPQPTEPQAQVDELMDKLNDPLERLKQLEARLQTVPKQSGATDELSANETVNTANVVKSNDVEEKEHNEEPKNSEQPEDATVSYPRRSQPTPITAVGEPTRRPSFVPLDSERKPSTNIPTTTPRHSLPTSTNTWRIETDSLNMLMNQVLEQVERGPVSMNLIARVKAHPFYHSRPMVKELLESILAAQPPSVQEKASQIIQQQSQEILKQQNPGYMKRPTDKEPSLISGRRDSKTEKNSVINQTAYQNSEGPQMNNMQHNQKNVGFDPDEEPEQMETSVTKAKATEEVTQVRVWLASEAAS